MMCGGGAWLSDLVRDEASGSDRLRPKMALLSCNSKESRSNRSRSVL